MCSKGTVATPEENAHIEAYHGILKKKCSKELIIELLEKLNKY
jgi:hypothetical protein